MLKVDQVSKIFQLDGVEIHALKNISFQVEQGEFVAIMGPSGSGKSTLMHLIGCLDKPTSGRIMIENHNTQTMSETRLAVVRNQKIGFVFQQFNLLPRATALENVELPLIYANLPSSLRKRKAKAMLGKVGLQHRLSHFPNQLSGGQQQRVAIARALVNQPKIILADEPTGNLDSKTSQGIMRLFKQLNREGHTIITVTHEQSVAKQAQKIIKLKDGQVI